MKEEGQRWALDTDSKSMIYFRTNSYQFAYVDVTMSGRNNTLVLRFFGSKKPSVALYFTIVEKTPALESGSFKGQFTDENDALKDVSISLVL